MTGPTEFTIGSEVCSSDGPCGVLVRVVIDPVARTLTHLVVEPTRGRVRHWEKCRYRQGRSTKMILLLPPLVVLLILAMGFVWHFLWIFAAIFLIIWLVGLGRGRGAERGQARVLLVLSR